MTAIDWSKVRKEVLNSQEWHRYNQNSQPNARHPFPRKHIQGIDVNWERVRQEQNQPDVATAEWHNQILGDLDARTPQTKGGSGRR